MQQKLSTQGNVLLMFLDHNIPVLGTKASFT